MPLLRSYKPKHSKPSKVAPVLAVGGLTASLGAINAAALATSAAAASSDDFAQLRACESGGNYAINTGNGYYGAYQFDIGTWRGLGNSGLPSQASPATQDSAAAQLQSARGWTPWPGCSNKLGLGRDDSERASRNRLVVVAVSETSPSNGPGFGGTTLTTDLVQQNRQDVSTWQQRMKTRGWDIAVDGRYGQQSAGVAARFAAEKGLHVSPGTVDQGAWNAAWQAPIT